MVLVSKYENLIVETQYDFGIILPDKVLGRLLDRVHSYVHMIFVVRVTRDLHC